MRAACLPWWQARERISLIRFPSRPKDHPKNQFQGIWQCLTRSSEEGKARRCINYSGCVPTERRSYFAGERKLVILARRFWTVIGLYYESEWLVTSLVLYPIAREDWV